LVSHGPYRARQIDDVVAVGQQDLYAVTELAGTAVRRLLIASARER
jgi:hypothetical protein